ncbi:hypothetical protein [Candidatus Parabeggiatoa sp. HSG14]|uniref:hypothetical protein n=1 Tax=Candidatus Parabeggiatoa sp. HSG14 TaxID=3055593 RepID=UPI0025A88D2E|nr:hypothetical protein [Thiotrichales bacterium HSG14]
MKEETAVTLMRMATDLTLATLNKTRIDTKYGRIPEISKLTVDSFNDCAKVVFDNYKNHVKTTVQNEEEEIGDK